MPLTLITGPANAGKARAVLDALGRHRAQGDMALLVLPTAADVSRYRRELAGQGGASIGVRVLLFSGLIERIVRCAATAEPALAKAPLGQLARERMLCTLIAEVAPQLDGPRAGLARALAEAIAELELADVTPRQLQGALRGQAPGEGELLGAASAYDVHRRRLDVGQMPGEDELLGAVYDAYRRRLDRLGRLDPELRSRRALDVLRRRPELWRGAPVLLYGFDDLTALQLDAIETLSRVVGAPVTVSLAYESGRVAFAGRAWAFHELRPLASQHIELPANARYYEQRARPALHGVERGLFENGSEPSGPPLDPTGVVQLLEGGSERAELELVADAARGLIKGGIQPEEIAIVHRSPASIAEPLAEALEAAGVPHAITQRPPFSHTALGRALLGLIACACSVEATLGDLLAWLRAPGVLERIELADRLEARALRSGALKASEARTLWEQENWPLERIDRVAEAAQRGSLALLERAERDLLWLFAAPRSGAAAILGEAEAEQALALQAGLAALTELRELALCDQRLLGGAEGLVETLSTLALPRGETSLAGAIRVEATPSEAASAGAPGGVAPAGAASGGAVAVLDPFALRARRVRALLLCGLQEGVFPALASPEKLPATERLRERVGLLRAGPSGHEQALAVERYLLYATLSRPEEKLFLSWHTCDDDGSSTPPSLFLDDVRDLFEERLWQERLTRGLGEVDPLPQRSAAFPPDWAAPSRDRAAASPHDWVAASPHDWAAGNGGESAGSSAPRHARPPILRDPRLLAELRERRVWSASSLERWAACPVSWLIERLLGAEGLEPDPEHLQRGGLAHQVLNDVYAGLRARGGSAQIVQGSLSLACELMRESLERHREEYRLSASREREQAAIRRLEADLERYLECAAEQESPLEPTHLELPFGFPELPESLPALELGEDVALRGRIDRVDLGRRGEAVVYDYKSGRVGSDRSGTKWLDSSYFQMALYMRVAQRLLGVEVVGGLYQPLAGADMRARGVLATDTGVQLSCVRTDGCDSEQLEELVDEVCAAALAAAKEARSGHIEPRPATCSRRGGCMYPTICGAGGDGCLPRS